MKLPRNLAGKILLVVSLPFTAYFSIGSLFVAGGVQQGDPSVSWISVCVMVMLALVGIGMFALRLVMITRRKSGRGAGDNPPAA